MVNALHRIPALVSFTLHITLDNEDVFMVADLTDREHGEEGVDLIPPPTRSTMPVPPLDHDALALRIANVLPNLKYLSFLSIHERKDSYSHWTVEHRGGNAHVTKVPESDLLWEPAVNSADY